MGCSYIFWEMELRMAAPQSICLYSLKIPQEIFRDPETALSGTIILHFLGLPPDLHLLQPPASFPHQQHAGEQKVSACWVLNWESTHWDDSGWNGIQLSVCLYTGHRDARCRWEALFTVSISEAYDFCILLQLGAVWPGQMSAWWLCKQMYRWFFFLLHSSYNSCVHDCSACV